MASHPRLLDEEGKWIPRWLEKHGHDASAIEALAGHVDRFRRHRTIGEWDRIRAEAEGMGLWAEAAPRLLAVVDDARVAVQPVRERLRWFRVWTLVSCELCAVLLRGVLDGPEADAP